MISTEKTIWCDEDDCSTWRAFSVTTNKNARKFAREVGWACHPGGDYCPEHNTK